MRKLSWVILAAVLCVGLSLAAQPAKPGGAYSNLEQEKLSQLLTELKMTELLEAAAQGVGASVDARVALAEARKQQALKTKDQAERDQLLDQAVNIYGDLVATTEGDKSGTGKLRHLRFRLERIVLAGIIKVEPYVERLEYFLEHAGDAAAVGKFTDQAVRELDTLRSDLTDLQEKWNNDDEKMITGDLWKLEDFVREVSYRGAWVRYYRGTAVPKDFVARAALLTQVIENDVKQFAQAEDNSSGVKYQSLRLSGAAARELGQFDTARDFLRRADHAQAKPALRMKAKFEYVRTYLDQEDFDQAGEQIRRFRTEAAALAGIEPVAVDLQSTLLEARMLRLQAAKAKPTDAVKAAKLEDQAFDLLTELTNKHPAYRAPLINLLISLMGDREADDLRPAERLLLAEKETAKRTPQGLAKAKKILLSVIKDDKATPRQKGSALWKLGAIGNFQKKNLEAAANWSRLAREYPDDPNAKNAAMNAVMTYQAVLKESAVLLRQREFVRGYCGALVVLVDKFGQTEAKYLYEIGILMDILARHQDAIKYFGRIQPESDFYMPARYRILQQRVKDFQDRPPESTFDRRQQARQLASDLESYMNRAREFSAKPENKDRAAEVRGLGAQCGLLIAAIYRDIGNLADAIRIGEQVAKDWKDVPDVQRDARTLVVQIKLEQGKVDQILEELARLVAEDAPRAVKLLVVAVPKIGDRVERLAFATDAESKKLLADLRPAYERFSDQLLQRARQQGLKGEQMLPFRQAWAHAHEAGTPQQAAQALKIYEQLDQLKPQQAPFVRGLARCYRRLGQNQKAMQFYNRLVRGGLEETSGIWWRTQLERLQFYMAIMKDKPQVKGIKNVLTHIDQLRWKYKDPQMGGYYRLFNDVAAEAKQMLESISAAQSQPAEAAP